MSLELQARWLVSFLPTTDFEEPLAEQYNMSTARLYDEVRDFLSLHFSLSERPGPFWDAVRNDAKKSHNLLELLELWKYSVPTPLDPRTQRVYNPWSVVCILMGKNFYRDCKLSESEVVSLKLWQRYWRECSATKERVLPHLAKHRTLVEHMRKQAVKGTSVKQKPENKTVVEEGSFLVQAAPILAQSPIV